MSQRKLEETTLALAEAERNIRTAVEGMRKRSLYETEYFNKNRNYNGNYDIDFYVFATLGCVWKEGE